MLSRNDISKELGRKLAIVPINDVHLKENSYNFCASEYAWTLGEGDFIYNNTIKEFQLVNIKKESNKYKNFFSLKKGDKAIVELGGIKYILLLPRCTTLVETTEVISIPNYLGGKLHSKVGTSNLGIGHIGTMLGPNFNGHLLISLHNITDKIIVLQVNESFISATFDYLNSAIHTKNPTTSGHVDKMAGLGLHLTSEDSSYLTEDWKSIPESIQHKMKTSPEYKQFKKKRKWDIIQTLKMYLSAKTVVSIIAVIILLSLLCWGAYYLDRSFGTTLWSERFWNVIASGIVVSMVSLIIDNLKTKH